MLLLGTLPGIVVAGPGRGRRRRGRPGRHRATRRSCLMDLNMPGSDGVAATRRITAGYPGTRVVVLTTYANDDSIIRALQAGALGYLTKDATRAEIGRAVCWPPRRPGCARPRGTSSACCPPRPGRQEAAPPADAPADDGDLTRARGRRAAAHRGGPVQPGDRPVAVRQRGHSQDACEPHLARTAPGTAPRPSATPTPTGTPNPAKLTSQARNPAQKAFAKPHGSILCSDTLHGR